MMEDLSAPNTREASVRRFLAKGPPKGAATLRLDVTTNSTTVNVGDWDVRQWAANKELSPVVANDVMALITEHAEELEQNVVASLYFANESGTKVGAEKVINYRRAAAPLDSTGFQLAGDWQAQSVNAQRHSEAMMRMYMMNQAQNLQAMGAIISSLVDYQDRLTDRLADAELRERQAKKEMDDLLEALGQLGVDQADDERVTQAQERIVKLLEPLAKVAMAKLMSNG